MKSKMIIVVFFAATVLFSCKSAQQREIDAQQNVVNAKQNLRDTQVANSNEWRVFKAESQAQIATNEARIAELKVQMNKPGNTFDGMYRTRIEKLEDRNIELKTQLNNYEGNPSNWNTFKNDFNRGMKEMGNNIKDLFR